MKHISKSAEPLTKAAFAEFGEVIEMTEAQHFAINGGTIERFHDLAKVDIGVEDGGRSIISIGQCNAPVTLPFELKLMERHPLGTQAFIPMSATPVYVAVAPLGDSIDIAQIRVFISNGKQGFNYKKGVWHMPLVATEDKQTFLIVDRAGPGNNCDEYPLPDGGVLITS